MKNLVRGPTRNREVQGWDDKIIHFFYIRFLYNLEKIFYKEIIHKKLSRGVHICEKLLLGSIYLKNFNFINKYFILKNLIELFSYYLSPISILLIFYILIFIELFLCITGYFSNYFSFYSFIS